MDAKKFNLGDLMRKIKSGEVQLPDFQRSWIWSDEQIKSLLESVIRGFPINSILLLECNPADMKFSCRTISGVESVTEKPQQLILDGQQRLTSLFGALFSDKPVKFQKGKDKFYYVDMAKAIDSVKNFETKDDIIISVNDNKKLKAKGTNWDLSTDEKEFAAGMFPLNKIFDGTLFNWILSYTNHYANDADKQTLATEFNALVQKIARYEIVEVILERNTPLESVCKIFENVNRGGERLGVFDLLTAIFAMHVDENGNPIELGKDWDKVRDVFKDSDLNILEAVDKSDFITAVTLLVSYRNRSAKKPVSCKGEDILKLAHTDYLEYRNAVAEGFVEAAKFLAEDDNKITTKKYLPYAPQLIPMAVIFAELKLSGKANAASRKKIRQWYWCGVFGESYKDGHLARFAKDIVQVMKWIDKREFPEILRKTQIGALRLMSVKKLQSAAYKGMFAIIFQHGARDFLAGRNMGSSANFAESIDGHHIFPKKYCDAKKIPKERYDNIANKTPLLSKTNNIVGAKAPSVYLTDIKQKTGLSEADVDDFLESHFADAELCRADRFDEFIVDRAKKILDAVEKITDREIVGRDSPEIIKIFGTSLA